MTGDVLPHLQLPVEAANLGGLTVLRSCPRCRCGLRVRRQTTIVHDDHDEETGPWVCRECGAIILAVE